MVQNLKGAGLHTVFKLCQIWLQLIKKIVFCMHDMKAYWGHWGVTPDICNLSTSWRWVVSFYTHFTPRETPLAAPPHHSTFWIGDYMNIWVSLDALREVNENIKVKLLLSIKPTVLRYREWHGAIKLQTFFSTLATLENENWFYFLCFTFSFILTKSRHIYDLYSFVTVIKLWSKIWYISMIVNVL
jgi:hypothetical protein